MSERFGADLQAYLTDGYLPAIGIECHVQLKTETKLFTAVANVSGVEPKPNSAVGPLCLGLPGALPVVNERALELAITAGLALGAEIADVTSFDRKHYFYPDLPLGYQISQHHRPIVRGGEIKVPAGEGQSFTVRIERAHLEADAGKSTHLPEQDFSLVDLNRAGSPLLEIVSLPDMHSAAEARQYTKELYLRMIYAKVCEGDLFAGNLRFDVNVSLSRDPQRLGTRTEIKNLNSFRFVEQAAAYELARQLEILRGGGVIIQETRGWDEERQQTFSQRSKEDAHDYRYMPDPDIPPLEIARTQVEALEASLPLGPAAIRSMLRTWEVSHKSIQTILDVQPAAELLAGLAADLDAPAAKLLVNWLSGEILALTNKRELAWEAVASAATDLAGLAKLCAAGKVNSALVKRWLPDLAAGRSSLAALLKENAAAPAIDAAKLKEIVAAVFEQHPKAVGDARADRKAAGFLIGQVMRLTKGAVDPKQVASAVEEMLKE